MGRRTPPAPAWASSHAGRARIQWKGPGRPRTVSPMKISSLFKIALGAVLATLIVRYAGRMGYVQTILDDRFDSDIAPGAPF